ncbi:hypothetical protein D3C84_1155280 [compost metagenome]
MDLRWLTTRVRGASPLGELKRCTSDSRIPWLMVTGLPLASTASACCTGSAIRLAAPCGVTLAGR